jgi:hypothetical protein
MNSSVVDLGEATTQSGVDWVVRNHRIYFDNFNRVYSETWANQIHERYKSLKKSHYYIQSS